MVPISEHWRRRDRAPSSQSIPAIGTHEKQCRGGEPKSEEQADNKYNNGNSRLVHTDTTQSDNYNDCYYYSNTRN